VPLLSGAIMPHGDAVLTNPADRGPLASLCENLEAIGAEIARSRPEVIVIASPHHLRLQGRIAIITSSYLEGGVGGGGNATSLRLRVDREGARAVEEEAAHMGLPMTACGYATADESDLSVLPLDWGTLIPLSFVARAGDLPPVILVGPPRDIGLDPLRAFGAAVRRGLADRRFTLIASADLAHAHDPEGPYAFSPEADVYDGEVRLACESGDLSRLSALSPDLIEAAKADAPWQLAILEGALGHPVLPTHVAYACPTYFGMLSALFTP